MKTFGIVLCVLGFLLVSFNLNPSVLMKRRRLSIYMAIGPLLVIIGLLLWWLA